MAGAHEHGRAVSRAQRAAETLEQHLQAGAAALEPRRALVALVGRCRAHLAVHVRQQRRAAVATAGEQREHLVEAAPVGIGIEVAEAGRHAPPHLPVRRRPVAALHRAPAVAQPEQRVELLEQLDRRRTPAQRPDAHRMARGRRRRDVEHRVGDVEPAAQVDVAVLVLEADVARGRELLDEPVLQHERAELGLRRAVVDDVGLPRPRRAVGRRREVRAGARAQRDRLADVEHLARAVAKQVDAGVVGQARDVGPRRRARPPRRAAPAVRRARAPPRRAQRPQRRQPVADRHGVHAQLREQRAEHARAGLGVGERAVRRLDLDAERVGQRGELALAGERCEASRQRHGAQRRRVGPRQPGALARLAQHAAVEGDVVADEHAAVDLRDEVGQHEVCRRCLVHHGLRDPCEALDAATQRRAHADERLVALVQLAAADQDRADLGQLAGVARLAVRLGVDDEELGVGEWRFEEVGGHGPTSICWPPDVLHVSLRAIAVSSADAQG